MEGKEVRFGITQSVLTAVVTSNGATGSYNSPYDSYTPLGGAVPLVNMLLGEIVLIDASADDVVYPVFHGAGGRDAQCRPIFPTSRFREDLPSYAASSHSSRPT